MSAGTSAQSGRPAGARDDGPPPRRVWLWLAGVVVIVASVQPYSGVQIGPRPSFVPAMLSLVFGLDLLTALLLVREFRESGNRRAIALASAYVLSLGVLAGYAAAFPGVLDPVPPLGAWPSTAPWLWVAWHTGFPVLLAAAVAPWPRRWAHPVETGVRRRVVWATVGTCLGGAGLIVTAAVTGRSWLPVVIHGLDTSAMTRVAGPVMLPVVALSAVVAVVGGMRLSGPVRWAALAAAAALGDVTLTLFSFHRFSLGWYVGRSLRACQIFLCKWGRPSIG